MEDNKYILYRKDASIEIFSFANEKECLNFKNSNSNCRIFYCRIENALDLYFYRAFEWNVDADIPFINIEKAKNIRLFDLKNMRAPYFNFLDVEFMKTFENENEAKRNLIVQYKQALRNLDCSSFPNTIIEIRSFKPQIFLDVEKLLI
jgi:hypothetical protein